MRPTSCRRVPRSIQFRRRARFELRLAESQAGRAGQVGSGTRLVDRHSVLSGVLGLLQRQAGLMEKASRLAAAAVDDAGADRHADGSAVLTRDRLLGELLTNAIDHLRKLRARGPGDEAELLPAVARQTVDVADQTGGDGGEGPQDKVARRVAVALVDEAEVVQVCEFQRS